VYAFLIILMHAKCPSHLIILDIITLIIFCDKYNFLRDDNRLIVERRSECPNDPESYAGGSVRSW
jgi:hypothetical protein